MTLIDKDKLKAEIKRRMTENCDLAGKADCFGQRAVEDNDILAFIDTLPEQPELKPEQPVIKKSNALFDKCVENCDPAVMKEVSDNIDKMLGRKPAKGLEEAAEEYAEKHGFRVPYDGSNNFYDDVDVKASKEGFIAGAEWQREQDQSLIELAEDHAMLAGMNKMKEEMMEKARFLEVLDKWEKHAIRGMRNGATAYHQGKIALITDLRDWINGED